MDPAPLRLYLIRHGETEWSLSGQHTGRTDLPLTTRGEDQARALRPVLRAISFDHVLTSPARRARETSVLAGLGKSAEMEPDLAEWDYGEYEGRTSGDIRRDRPGWNVFRDGCPGGESVEAVTLRADRLITRAAAQAGNVALFSSGQFGCSLAVRWIGLPLLQAQHLMLGTGSVSVLAYNPAHPDLRVIAHWNHVAADPRGSLRPSRVDAPTGRANFNVGGRALAMKIERRSRPSSEIPAVRREDRPIHAKRPGQPTVALTKPRGSMELRDQIEIWVNEGGAGGEPLP